MKSPLNIWLIAITFPVYMLLSTVAHADQTPNSDQVVRELFLTHHEFQDWHFTPRANDKIQIHNQANISHSIYITYPDGTELNLGVKLPGETTTWTIPAAGDYLLQCWIHPIIRAKMTVSP